MKDPFAVPCRYCHAAVGEPCTNKALLGDPGPLTHGPAAHPTRLLDANAYEFDAAIDYEGELF